MYYSPTVIFFCTISVFTSNKSVTKSRKGNKTKIRIKTFDLFQSNLITSNIQTIDVNLQYTLQYNIPFIP